MKQVVQDMRSGRTSIVEIPAPLRRSGCLLVAAQASLVSSGTERMLVEFGKKGWLNKAKARPDLITKVIEKVVQEGPVAAWNSVSSRLEQPFPTGYSLAGVVIETGPDTGAFRVGDLVACAGVPHAEIVNVPKHLCVKREGLSAEEGAFVALGSIALQGLRLGQPQAGENVAVIGLGLVGQLCAQLAKASGCRVLGIDLDPKRCRLAESAGISTALRKDAEAQAPAFTQGRGFDLVLIAADTPSSDPVELAGEIARDRASVIAVGAVGLQIPRRSFYHKELNFRVSRSYGPGRYDAAYEEKGQDYPIGYVRWTEGRNMEAFLELVANGAVDVKKLISHRFAISEGAHAYELLSNGAESSLAVLLTYPDAARPQARRIDGPESVSTVRPGTECASIGLIGCGQFASGILLPALKRIREVRLIGAASASGLTARACADRFGFSYCASTDQELLKDENINTLFIATRHRDHARQVAAALKAGKNVFVEKPLCLSLEEISDISAAYEASRKMKVPPVLTVGFNRRFAPYAVALKEAFDGVTEPRFISVRFNAGFLAANHWSQTPDEGGRILGEACHALDLANWLSGRPAKRVTAVGLPNAGRYNGENAAITVEYEDGSVASVTYLANGDRRAGKEYIEMHAGGRSGQIDDYKRLTIARNGRVTTKRSWFSQDKGHNAEVATFVEAVLGRRPAPIPFPELVYSTKTALAALESLKNSSPVDVCL